MRFGNRATIPSGMLHPAGVVQTLPDPAVQSTVRPFGTLLRPSPGYDAVRLGKSEFQGRGPTGGFRPMEFAEDVGGSGAALAVVPGETTQVQASEWIPLGGDIAEGTMIVSDRATEVPGFAQSPGEAYNTIPDMGDRTAGRPRSFATFLSNPYSTLRADYRAHPAITVAASIGFLALVNIVLKDLERDWNVGGRGIGSATASVPASGVQAGGDVTKDVADVTEKSVRQIGEATDNAVNKIGQATDNAVSKIESAAS